MKTTVSNPLARSTEPFAQRFTFWDDVMWIARVCATQLPDFKAAHVGMGAMETKGDEFGRLDVLMLYTSDDPTMEERPAAVYVRNDKGHMVKVDGVHRGSGWQVVTRSGHLLQPGLLVADARGVRYAVQGCVAPLNATDHGRVLTDLGSYYPSLFHARFVNFSR